MSAHEHDITLPIKVSVYVRSRHLVLGLGTEHFAWHLVSGT